MKFKNIIIFDSKNALLKKGFSLISNFVFSKIYIISMIPIPDVILTTLQCPQTATER